MRTVHTIKIITNEHLLLVLPVCVLPETAVTYDVHCATVSTLPLAMSTRTVDLAADGTANQLCLLPVRGLIDLRAAELWGIQGRLCCAECTYSKYCSY
jgi:hypothetical protein